MARRMNSQRDTDDGSTASILSTSAFGNGKLTLKSQILPGGRPRRLGGKGTI